MALSKLSFALILLAAVCCFGSHSASAASSRAAPAPAVDCSSLILSMADCLSFVSNGSKTEKPEATCCTGLKTVLKADAACLCEAFKSSAQLGVVLNVTKAMTLPAACKVSAPSAAKCRLSDAPAASAASSRAAPAPAVDCSSLILSMADCLSFVSNGSKTEKPEATCCTGLKTVLKADAACLCEAFKSSAQLGVVLNVTKAMTLPAACKVSAPSAAKCRLSDAPAASAASSRAAPAPAVDCSSLILSMADCLSFVSNGSKTEKPEATCCTGLKTVLKADAACLCEAFKSSAQLGVVLNVTKAMTLPAACKVSAPSAAKCRLSDAPAGAPAGAALPPASSPTSVAAAPGSSAGGSNVVAPAAAPGNSASATLFSSVTLSLGLLVVTFSLF